MNFHTFSRIHNLHLKIYASLFLGQFKGAMEAAEEIIATTPEGMLRIENPGDGRLDGSLYRHEGTRFHPLRQVAGNHRSPLPHDPELYAMSSAVWHYAKTIAHAALGNVPCCRGERERLFYQAVTRVPERAMVFNNTCLDVLKIAEQMLLGEIEYRKENYAVAYDHLRQAVVPRRQPQVRRTLGLDATRAPCARRTATGTGPCRRSRAGVSRRPRLIRHAGQHLATPRQPVEPARPGRMPGAPGDQMDEAKHMRARLNLAKARADVPILASCACRMQHHCCED